MVAFSANQTAPSWRAAELPLFLLTIFVRILCAPVTCDAAHPAFLFATSRSNNTADLTGFAEAPKWINSVIPRRQRVRILYESKHRTRVALGVAHAR